MAEQTFDTRAASRKNLVWGYQFEDYDIPAATAAAISKDLPIVGVIRQIHVTTSAHGSVTYTHTIKSPAGRTIYAKAAIASGGTDSVTLTADTELYCPSGCTVEILVSLNPTTTETVTVEYIGW